MENKLSLSFRFSSTRFYVSPPSPSPSFLHFSPLSITIRLEFTPDNVLLIFSLSLSACSDVSSAADSEVFPIIAEFCVA